jgi:hypothetical protein
VFSLGSDPTPGVVDHVARPNAVSVVPEVEPGASLSNASKFVPEPAVIVIVPASAAVTDPKAASATPNIILRIMIKPP